MYMRTLLPLSLLALTGCDQLQDALNLKVPTGELNRVDLARSPTVDQLASWGCFEYVGSDTCSLLGFQKPKKSDMQFSFDLVFDLHNPNANVAIPLVDLLLGFTAFGDQNLGSVCLSFCDPDDAECVPQSNAEGACHAKGADDIEQPEDLIPTVDDLLTLAQDVTADGTIDNGAWRTIPGKETVESHVQFDLGIDTFLGLADDLLNDAADDLLSGRQIKVDVPYTAEGSLFFDIPDLGRKGIGFGPFADTWTIKAQ
jgi:hypothetical protein